MAPDKPFSDSGWRDQLSIEEAKELFLIEEVATALKASLKSLSARRGVIQARALERCSNRLKKALKEAS